jgi:hypothetical protein
MCRSKVAATLEVLNTSGADVESTVEGWGNSGTWDEDNSILADGGG